MNTNNWQLNAVVFDWAGTVVDFGSCAPMGALVELFNRFNIQLTIEQARVPMGMAKREHIQALLRLPEIEKQWVKHYGALANEGDLDRLYEAFIPINGDVIADYAGFIPGALDMINELKAREIKIGSSTGYNHTLMDILAPIAAKGGYVPDCIACAGDTPAGRPAPFMMYKNFAELGVWSPSTVVKVDDTGVGIQEGVNAGAWAVGVTVSGNEVGLSYDAWQALPGSERDVLKKKAEERLRAAGAHYIVDTVAELIPVLDEIDLRIASGERPYKVKNGTI